METFTIVDRITSLLPHVICNKIAETQYYTITKKIEVMCKTKQLTFTC